MGETPAKPGLQFQRGFLIVPAAFRFVNEGGHELLIEPRSGARADANRLVTDDSRKLLETGGLNANWSDSCLGAKDCGAREGKHRFTL
jgi:hypothetical protein